IRDWSVTGVQTCALPIFSILITSAPRSPKIWPANGAATLWPSSITTMPARGAGEFSWLPFFSIGVKLTGPGRRRQQRPPWCHRRNYSNIRPREGGHYHGNSALDHLDRSSLDTAAGGHAGLLHCAAVSFETDPAGPYARPGFGA